MLNYADKNRLAIFKNLCETNKYFNVGYPEDFDFDYSELKDFLDYSLNNCGDHEAYCNYVLNTFQFEKEAVDWFIRAFKGEPKDIYGYVTHGGTEGNLWGMWIAREKYPEGIVYLSKDSHYSAAKNIRMLGMDSKAIDIDQYGVMVYSDLAKKVDTSKPAIIFATIGSTARGAVDDVSEVISTLKKAGVKEYYIHGDQALSGAILPFVDDPQPYSFEDGFDSLTVCLTKGFGSPMPAAVALAKRKNLENISCEIDYIKSHDLTVAGSRNGFTPLIAWYIIKAMSMECMRERVKYKLDLAQYVVDELNKNGVKAWRSKNSITVVAPRPSEAFIHKHKLAPFDDSIHIITTAHNTMSSLDLLIYELLVDYDITLNSELRRSVVSKE
ncbi:L-histidine carboxy-lyase (histamine-forming) [Sinobacterium caligoides]|uniref:L-histidine carboxy-lyase (Histamine-forming) n=1 Tax=Sinobacterium caligoides TaxID=933926 RepID=A0A3N2E0D4_9GAMM|nr:histidine decarboxylase [Sinobacterium caligoides]ROS05372.1 L-histidine carboxy-lyase (histamine-forming) [Sinobacterium caligoides]